MWPVKPLGRRQVVSSRHSDTGGRRVMRVRLVFWGSGASGTGANAVDKKSTFLCVFKSSRPCQPPCRALTGVGGIISLLDAGGAFTGAPSKFESERTTLPITFTFEKGTVTTGTTSTDEDTAGTHRKTKGTPNALQLSNGTEFIENIARHFF